MPFLPLTTRSRFGNLADMTLTQYLDQENLTAAEFGRRIGVSPAAMTRYCAGERFPNTAILRKIMSETRGQVTPNDFLETNRTSAATPGRQRRLA